MTYPAGVATVTVTFDFAESLPSGGVPTGNVTFAPNATLYDGTAQTIVVVAPLVVQLVNGAGSAVVMATDDSHLSPTGWAYSVTFNVGGVSWSAAYFFPAASSPVDLSTLAPAVSPPALTQYVSLSAVGAHSGVASLDSTGNVPAAQLGNAAGGVTLGNTVTASAVGDAGTAGVGGAASRVDHKHAREGYGPVTSQTTYGASATNGVANTDARSDHGHGTPAAPTPAGIGALAVANNLSDVASLPTARANMSISGSLPGWGPAQQGFAGWNFDPQSIASASGQFIGGATPGKGIIAMNAIYVPYAQTITNVGCYIGAAGTALASCFMGLIDINGNVLSVTADLSTFWQSTGLSLKALSAAQSVAAGVYFVPLLVGNGSTTGPQFLRGGSSGVIGAMNANLTAATSRWATTGSGLSAITGPITMSGLTQTSVPFWVCWS